MNLIVFRLLLFCLTSIGFHPGPHLSDQNRFVITLNDKKGFVNTSGKIVIEPQFQDAMEFSEGLCAVRIDGRYGFINTDGELVIPAVYDYATLFVDKLALVFLDGKPQFITQDGRVAFISDYMHMTPFTNGRSRVQTYSGKFGIIDTKGKLIVDTAYSAISIIDDGFFVAYGLEHVEIETSEQKANPQVTVLDGSGKRLFPFGKYAAIKDYHEGYFLVEFPERKKGDISVDAIVDIHGNIVFSLPEKQESWIDGSVYDGVIRVSLPRSKRASEYYDAYVDIHGKFVYSDKSVHRGTNFRENVAFVGDEDFSYVLINRQGKVLSKERFGIPCCSSENPFVEGKAVVEFSDKTWGVIDTGANVILKTNYSDVFPRLVQGNYLFFQSRGADSEEILYGMIDLKGEVIIPPMMQAFDPRGFVNDLLKAWENDRVVYYNRTGAKVWQDPFDEDSIMLPLNIDYMNRGYFYVDDDYTGHPSESENVSPKTASSPSSFMKNALSVFVDTSGAHPSFLQVAKGFSVYVANTTSDTAVFNAQDNRLYMKMQAQDKSGIWRDIEYLPSSWCGNSYHTVTLPPLQYWSFVAPVYDGAIATRLRIALTYVDPEAVRTDSRKRRHRYQRIQELTIYSNEFDGHVNPAQFWRRPDYTPSGIMDPYNE